MHRKEDKVKSKHKYILQPTRLSQTVRIDEPKPRRSNNSTQPDSNFTTKLTTRPLLRSLTGRAGSACTQASESRRRRVKERKREREKLSSLSQTRFSSPLAIVKTAMKNKAALSPWAVFDISLFSFSCPCVCVYAYGCKKPLVVVSRTFKSGPATQSTDDALFFLLKARACPLFFLDFLFLFPLEKSNI